MSWVRNPYFLTSPLYTPYIFLNSSLGQEPWWFHHTCYDLSWIFVVDEFLIQYYQSLNSNPNLVSILSYIFSTPSHGQEPQQFHPCTLGSIANITQYGFYKLYHSYFDGFEIYNLMKLKLSRSFEKTLDPLLTSNEASYYVFRYRVNKLSPHFFGLPMHSLFFSLKHKLEIIVVFFVYLFYMWING